MIQIRVKMCDMAPRARTVLILFKKSLEILDDKGNLSREPANEDETNVFT